MGNTANLNSLWASIIVATLTKLGLKQAVISPGSRSTPLTLAFASQTEVEAIPILDERSAAYFALGLAKRSHFPVALICTSGTAAANFYPALIEAKYSQVPLLVLTADRPLELRGCHAGQTINQNNLYGYYPQFYLELLAPTEDGELRTYLRQNLLQAWERCLYPTPGVVHLNCPWREPFTPFTPEVLPPDFFAHLTVSPPVSSRSLPLPLEWQNCSEGIIIGGLAAPEEPESYCQAIANLSRFLGWPVLAEALSPLRNYASLNPFLISTYDLLLRQPSLAEAFSPKQVIQIGELPTSKELRQWLAKVSPLVWIISDDSDNYDPLHGQTRHIRGRVEDLSIPSGLETREYSAYLQKWCDSESKYRTKIDQELASLEELVEAKAVWLLCQILPPQTPVVLANSMSVRYGEMFWVKSDRQLVPYFNRGANGIDGTLSTALGIAHGGSPSILLTGDLALLHDTNGFLTRRHFQGHLTIILINNNGGGIFEMLPIAEFDPPFEEFFATPQFINFADLAQVYGVEYKIITTWQQLTDLLNPLPTQGIRLLEITTNRKLDAAWLRNWWQS